MPPRQFLSTVVSSEPVMGDGVVLTFTCPPGMAKEARAGRFVHLLCREAGALDPFLRRAYSVCAAAADRDELSVLVRPFGRASRWLVRRRADDSLDVFGLLGNAFRPSPNAMNLLLVGGGVGVAPLMRLAAEAVEYGRNVTLLLGAADEVSLLPPSLLPSTVEYAVATIDGSRGQAGVVTDLVPDHARWADQVFACGPEPMFYSLKRALEPYRIGGKPSVQVAVERPMACGMGTCLGCAIATRRGTVPSCVDGPIFDLDDLA
jgi:dihydroorotate dehydrogenase electron transfer subunit